ncbi:MAG: 16S rRNA (cytosine(1402)-N(4))-methyltransferase RsmH [Actinobacteria bacterium]|nr:16S rRNA (cytosine(1402)-N(4))-methyltransferase RsmH [Actinomycetota bacterium]
MVAEVVGFLGGRDVVADLTLGQGGHSLALLEAGVGRVVGVDRDPEAVAAARERLSPYGDRFHAVVGRFSEHPEERVDGALYDLGLSSMQLGTPARGFGYRVEGPLDMRMGTGGRTAADIVNQAPEEELGRLLREYGEERHWRRIAGAIGRARARRPIATTGELARIVAGAVPRARARGAPHPARRTFQALRIAVNRELEELAASLPRTAELLAPGGRIVVIAYHSLEDRIVKRFFLGEERLTVLTRKPLRPAEAEVAANPRARSARLRAAERASGEAA